MRKTVKPTIEKRIAALPAGILKAQTSRILNQLEMVIVTAQANDEKELAEYLNSISQTCEYMAHDLGLKV